MKTRFHGPPPGLVFAMDAADPRLSVAPLDRINDDAVMLSIPSVSVREFSTVCVELTIIEVPPLVLFRVRLKN